MKIKPIDVNTTFKSGYPTFNTAGHLSYYPDIYDLVYLGFRPSGILKLNGSPKIHKLDYEA